MNSREGLAGDALGRPSHELRETLIAVEDRSIRRQRQRTLPHLFDHQPVRLVGAAERVNLLAFRRVDDERVDVSVADGADGVFGFLQPTAEFVHRLRRPSAAFCLAIGPAGALGRISRPTSTRCSSDMSPIS